MVSIVFYVSSSHMIRFRRHISGVNEEKWRTVELSEVEVVVVLELTTVTVFCTVSVTLDITTEVVVAWNPPVKPQYLTNRVEGI